MSGLNRDEIIKIAQKVTGVSFPLGIDGISIGMNEKHLQDFANAIAATEREACAKLCEDVILYRAWITKEEVAAAIRARGNNAA